MTMSGYHHKLINLYESLKSAHCSTGCSTIKLSYYRIQRQIKKRPALADRQRTFETLLKIATSTIFSGNFEIHGNSTPVSQSHY